MTQGRHLAILAALFGLVGSGQAQAGIIETFLRCDAEVFAALEGEHAAFGRISVSPLQDELPRWFKGGSEAIFERPLRGFGFRFERYRQATDPEPLQSWYWGFVVAAKPRQVAFAIDPYLRRQRISEAGFQREGQDYWRAGIGAPKSGRWRELMIWPLEGGKSFLACHARKELYQNFGGLPVIETLFGARP